MAENYTSAYPERIYWENWPSTNTRLNANNLNKMDSALKIIDDRVMSLDTAKVEYSDIAGNLTDFQYNDKTGVITITYKNGSVTTINTSLSKVVTNWVYDYAYQRLELTHPDGTKEYIGLSSLIQNNEFANTDTINMSVDGSGKVSANILEGSIHENHLDPNYLAALKVSEQNAKDSENNAYSSYMLSRSYAVGDAGVRYEESIDNAKYYSEVAWDNAKTWAVGGTYTRNGEDEDNSKFYSQVSKQWKDIAQAAVYEAKETLATANKRISGLNVLVNFSDGNLYYDMEASGVMLQVNQSSGNLMWEVIV